MVAPGEFIPLAEEMGLIEAIGDWVLEELAASTRSGGRAGLSSWRSAFNLSPRQLWQPDLAEKVLAQARDGRRRPGSDHRRDHRVDRDGRPRPHAAILTRAARVGLHAGDRRLRHRLLVARAAKHMPVDILKIDQSFVRDVDYDRDLGEHGARHDPAGAEPGHGARWPRASRPRGVRVPARQRLPLRARASCSRRPGPGRGGAALAARTEGLLPVLSGG